jgi:signal transduction histidine kinase
MDLLVLTILTYLTGGMISLYALMPLLYIVAAAPLLGSRWAYVAAGLATCMYSSMVLLELGGILPHSQPVVAEPILLAPLYENHSVTLSLLLTIVGLTFLGAYVGGNVARQLEQQREESAQSYRAARDEARKMHLLNDLARSLTAILAWPTLLARVFTELEGLIAFDYAAMYLYDEVEDRLRLVATRGFSDREAKEAESTAMERHPGWVVRKRQSMLVDSTEKDPRIRYLGPRQSASLLMAPLLYQDRCLGALGLGSRQEKAFTADELDLLQGLAGQLAVAVANARLFDESRQTLEELNQTQERLIRSSRLAAVGELMAGLAHELNNPLGIIVGNAQLALELPNLDPEVHRCLEEIEVAGERITRLVRVLSDLQSLGEERFAEIDVEQLLQETLTGVQPQIEAQGIKIEQSIESSLRPLWGSRARLVQALQNLLVNAIEAMRDQQGAKQIVISARSDEDEIVLSVRDSGPGIPAGQLSQAFEPGFTTKVEQGRSRALGLGLFSAYYTARAHAGDLKVLSQEGIGTEVEVRLPAVGV